jgi:hypothetical protein
LAVLAALGLVSCSGTDDVVEVRQYHLRAINADTGGIPPIQAEKLKRLHGAVSIEEQRQRLGHYYTVSWDGPAGREGEPVRVVLEYRQASTASKILRMESEAAAGRKGKLELQVTGPAYLEGGRVLSWHLSFYRGGELITTRQSYQWE